MESERPHRTTSTTSSSTSELFICFTSRLSTSSSMKLSSKSILSPGRNREPSQVSLSSSLSRRLRSNGSMKGGQASPMFPTGGKKRGCGFENPEPSSPKVTCIGQVRVKTKKQGKKMRARSKRRGEASFRRVEQANTSAVTHQELSIQNNAHSQFQSHQILQHQQQECLPHRNQRWVHLPLTICEALRAFSAEFNCFLPCRSSCMTSEREKEEKAARSNGDEGGNGRSCGAVFARWLVAMQDGEGKGREMELVVGEEERDAERSGSLRRREIFDGGFEIKEQVNEVPEEEEARVSVCIPPKNALLLMRCRSDPVKMAALANKFWGSPVQKEEDMYDNKLEEEGQRDEEEEEGDVDVEVVGEGKVEVETEVKGDKIREKSVSDGEQDGDLEEKGKLGREEEIGDVQENCERISGVTNELQEHPLEQEEEDNDAEEEDGGEGLEGNHGIPREESALSCSSPEVLIDPQSSEMEENMPKLVQEDEDVYENVPNAENEEEEQETEDDKGASFPSSSLLSILSGEESEVQEAKPGASAEEAEASEEENNTPEWPSEDGETTPNDMSEPEFVNTDKPDPVVESEVRESQQKSERGGSVLPDCLLLMMCEPKLSMEVSKETWVCSTDFIRCLPERTVKQTNGRDQVRKLVTTEDSNTKRPVKQQLQPPRSSCSFPAGSAAPRADASMASVIEQKLVGSKGYEPLVLTRCKSEPMRSAAKFAPENCFWKNRKLEPHRPATLGVGAAGVGC